MPSIRRFFSVLFRGNLLSKSPEKAAAVKQAVEKNYEENKAYLKDVRGVEQAVVRENFHGHDDHLTVDYQKEDGEHVTTKHVGRNGETK